jgi:hypothetical protein
MKEVLCFPRCDVNQAGRYVISKDTGALKWKLLVLTESCSKKLEPSGVLL